jgi:hypothetical protein
MSDRPTPKFTGVDTYRDPKGRFQFRYPMDWHAHILADKREGILYSPEAHDPQTWFAVWVTDLKEKIVAEDLPVLRKGLDQGFAEMQNVQIELATDDTLQNLIKFERVFTFEQGEQTRKWRQWVMYVDHWMIVVTYQAQNPVEYDYWYAMINHSFLTFNIPQELWFAVDRNLAGTKKATNITEAA